MCLSLLLKMLGQVDVKFKASLEYVLSPICKTSTLNAKKIHSHPQFTSTDILKYI